MKTLFANVNPSLGVNFDTKACKTNENVRCKLVCCRLLSAYLVQVWFPFSFCVCSTLRHRIRSLGSVLAQLPFV